MAESALEGAQPAIIAWLDAESSRIIVPPEAAEPRVDVLAESWSLDGVEIAIRVSAWDQCGMVPVNAAARELEMNLPADVVDAARTLADSPRPGLDLLPTFASDRRVFPGGAPFSLQPPLGALLATHNPPQPGAKAEINLNTAPRPLLEAALRAAGRGGIEAIVESRRRGMLAQAAPRVGPRREGGSPSLVVASGLWAIRIDVQVEEVERSWWQVHRREWRGFEMVQRLEIDE